MFLGSHFVFWMFTTFFRFCSSYECGSRLSLEPSVEPVPFPSQRMIVKNAIQCETACRRDSKCKSLNYDFKTGFCDLNTFDHGHETASSVLKDLLEKNCEVHGIDACADCLPGYRCVYAANEYMCLYEQPSPMAGRFGMNGQCKISIVSATVTIYFPDKGVVRCEWDTMISKIIDDTTTYNIRLMKSFMTSMKSTAPETLFFIHKPRMYGILGRNARILRNLHCYYVHGTQCSSRTAEPYISDSAEFSDTRIHSNDGWVLLLRATANVNISVYDVWMNDTIYHDQPEVNENVQPGCMTLDTSLPCDMHFKSKLVTTWESAFIGQVKVVVLKNNTVKAEIVFDGVGSTKNSWFKPKRVINSTWTDIKTSKHNYFSLRGHDRVDRRFQINSYYSGCPGDVGWLVVADKPGNEACSWEKAASKPNILFSAATNATLCAEFESGDVMAILATQNTTD